MERSPELGDLVSGRRYMLLTMAATGIAVAGAVQRLRAISSSDSLSSVLLLVTEELLSSRVSAVIVLHFFLVIMYHVFLLLARTALGRLRPLELQQTKETLIPFVLLRCQLLVSTMGPTVEREFAELGLLVVWLAVLAVMRALLALTHARFQYLLTRPMTRLGDLQRLGAVLGVIVVLDLGLAVASLRLDLVSARIMYVPWFEASLMLLRTLELGLQVGFHSLDVRAMSILKDEEMGWENSEFYLLLLQTVLCGCYLVQLVVYYFYVISADQFRVSLFDLILILNVKNATVRLLEKVKYVKLYHQVVLDLDHLFPDALPEELESVADDVCAICLKPMLTQAKKLRCGHLFHRLCLRQCLQKASASDSLAGVDPFNWRMANEMGREGSLLQVGETVFAGSTSMRCPICRKQVCGGKCDEMTFAQPEEIPRQLESEAVEPQEAGQQQQLAATNVQGGAQEHVGANEAAPEEVLRFSTAFLSRWVPFPNFSFEIVRHRGQHDFEVTQEMLQQILEVFPQYTLEEIRADLIRSRSVERTMERILNGRLNEQRNIGRADTDANEILDDAVNNPEDFRWSFSTLTSALWGANLPTLSAPVEVETYQEDNTGHPNAPPLAVRLHPHGVGEAEPLLRRLQRWRGRRLE